jgi:hypothetical protein
MPVSVENPNYSLYESLLKEVDRIKVRQKEIDTEKSDVIKALSVEKRANITTLKALNVLILRIGGTAPSSNGKKGKAYKRRYWPRDIKRPQHCLLGAKFHSGQDTTEKSFGLCGSHITRERKGELTEAESTAYHAALQRLGVEG